MTVATRADWTIWVNQSRRTPGVAEDPLEVRVQRGQVEQGLADVEHLHTAHRDLLALPGPR